MFYALFKVKEQGSLFLGYDLQEVAQVVIGILIPFPPAAPSLGFAELRRDSAIFKRA